MADKMDSAIEQWLACDPASRQVRISALGNTKIRATAYVGDNPYVDGKPKKELEAALVALDKELTQQAMTVAGVSEADIDDDDDDGGDGLDRDFDDDDE